MPYRHRQCSIGALLGMQPQVGKLAGFRIIRTNHDNLGALIPRFSHKMRIGGAGLWYV